MADFNIPITIPDDMVADVRDTLAEVMGYTPEDGNKVEFIQRKVRDYLKDMYIAGKLDAKRAENRAEYEALEETNRAEEEAVRVEAEGVSIDVG